MNEKIALVTTTDQNWLTPITTVQNMIVVYNQMADFVRDALREGVDYGRIPGTSKDTLYKPGSEKLARFFGLSPSFIDLETTEDWMGVDHGGEPFFYYRQKCELYRNGALIANAQGSCNSWEKKYRYRQQKQICPTCENETIIKGKEEYGGGWLCWKKNGGCGTKFRDGDQAIEGQKTGQVKNPDIHDQVNTILKMAQKRAFVASVLLAVNGSEYFTQDVEDISFGNGGSVVEGSFKDPKKPTAKKQPQKKAAVKSTAKKKNGNGVIAPLVQALMDAKVSDTIASAAGVLNLLELPKDATAEHVVEKGKIYRAWKDSGKTTKEAAELTNKGEVPE